MWLFGPIKKVNLDIELKKTKQIKKTVWVMKEDKQTFRVMLGKEMDLEEASRYPVTSVPLMHFQIRLLEKFQNIISVII